MLGETRIKRLSKYKEALRRMKTLSMQTVYSSNLAEAIGIKATQVRKDLSIFNISGNKRAGYDINELLEQISVVLHKETPQKAVIVGYGKIGGALSKYKGFNTDSMDVAACFDTDENKINPDAEIPVLPLNELSEYIKSNGIEVGIIAVPELQAQAAADTLVNAGVKGILNFAPIRLVLPKGCCVNNVNLAAELESLFYFVRNNSCEGQAEGEE